MFEFMKRGVKPDPRLQEMYFENMINTAPAIPPSEGMIQMDKFFHSAWLLLKHKRPDLCKDMQEVELIIAGYDPEGDKPEEEKEKKPEGTVL